MSNKSTKFDYDAENDILFIYDSKKKSKGSIEYGKDIHISFSSKGELTGLEFLNASEMFHELFGREISKEKLSNIEACNLWDGKKRGLRMIKFACLFSQKERPLDGQLVMQDINFKSPILAVAR